MTGVCAVVAVVVLFFILGYLVYHGSTSINWNFFTKLPAPLGETGGGMANAIVGSGKLLLLAALIGVPVGFLGAIYLAEFSGTTVAFIVRYAADLLNGVPSIVIGIFAYILAVLPFKHFSTLAGGLALGLMMIPITLRSTEEFLRAVPRNLREGAMALGASKAKTIATVIVPAAYRGILTAVLLAFARVAGETAPLLFTALGNRYWSPGWNQPTSSLPVMIYNYALSPYEDWHRQAWAAGLVLLGLILVINILARAILSRGVAVPRSSNMHASVRRAVSVTTTPAGRVSASREAAAPLPMRMSINHVNFFYGTKQTLFDISLGIAVSKVTALIGPSGCGKSTLLRTLNRMHETVRHARLEGEILLDGQNILAQDVTQLRRRVGMVFQRPNPFPKSIFDNVAYGLRINGTKLPIAEAVGYVVEDG